MDGMSEAQARDTDSGGRTAEKRAVPGIALGLAIAIGSGLTFSVWGLPKLAAERPAMGANNAGTLAEVAAGDVAGALSTMDVSSTARAGLEEKNRECGSRLAWVSIVRAPGQPDGKIRLQSGTYFSPLFTLGDEPVRVAIRFPAPYESGHGVIAAFVVGGAAVVGLTPAWHVPASADASVRNVTWQPRGNCGKPHG